MKDITWFIREKIFRKSPIKNTSSNAWEELSEKKTTKLGYFLLICMFLAIISTTYWSLSIISWIIDYPKYPSYELQNVVSNLNPERNDVYKDYYNYEETFETTDAVLQEKYTKGKEISSQIIKLFEEKESVEYDIRDKKYLIENLEKQYTISLTEKIADVSNNASDLKESIKLHKEELLKLEKQVENYDSKINLLKNENNQLFLDLNKEYEKQQKNYKINLLLYKLYNAILSLVFVWILFFVSYHFYVKTKTKNHPYAIIFSVATFAYGLMFLKVILYYLWDLIPHTIVKLIIEFISNFKILIYIIQFIWPILVIWFFGFFVYKIQKRLYSKENILKRIIKEKKCPNCWNDVDITKPFCCLCWTEILEKCSNCWNLTIKWMKHCYNCWTEINKKS